MLNTKETLNTKTTTHTTIKLSKSAKLLLKQIERYIAWNTTSRKKPYCYLTKSKIKEICIIESDRQASRILKEIRDTGLYNISTKIETDQVTGKRKQAKYYFRRKDEKEETPKEKNVRVDIPETITPKSQKPKANSIYFIYTKNTYTKKETSIGKDVNVISRRKINKGIPENIRLLTNKINNKKNIGSEISMKKLYELITTYGVLKVNYIMKYLLYRLVTINEPIYNPNGYLIKALANFNDFNFSDFYYFRYRSKIEEKRELERSKKEHLKKLKEKEKELEERRKRELEEKELNMIKNNLTGKEKTEIMKNYIAKYPLSKSIDKDLLLDIAIIFFQKTSDSLETTPLNMEV